MKIKKLLVLILLVVLCGGLLVWKLYFQDCFYSKKLIEAIRKGEIESVKEIVENHPNAINELPSLLPKGWNSVMNMRVVYPLTEACIKDDIFIVKMLLQNGANVNANNGYTALSVTYTGKRENWYEISLLLIEAGASLNYITDQHGESISVLQDIVQARSGELAADYISENEKKVMNSFEYALWRCDHKQVDWASVLQHSITNDRIEIVKFLLDDAYCDVNDISRGMSPLMFATRDSTIEMIELLLDYGADKNYESEDGKTVMDYAFQYQDENVINLLKTR